jgi:hypothetical protein
VRRRAAGPTRGLRTIRKGPWQSEKPGGISRKALKHWKTALKIICRSSHRTERPKDSWYGCAREVLFEAEVIGEAGGWLSLYSEIGFEYGQRAMRLSLSQGLGNEAISESTAGNSGRLLTARSETGLSPADRPKYGGLCCRISRVRAS